VTSEIERQVKARLGGVALPAPFPEQMSEGVPLGFAEIWSAAYARRTAMLWCLWFFALLGFYGLTTWLGALLQQKGFPVTKSVFYTLLISLAGVPGFLTSAWLVETWGRKGTCVLMLLGSAIAAYLYGTASNQMQLIIFGLGMQFFLFGMWSGSTPTRRNSIRPASAQPAAALPPQWAASARCSAPLWWAWSCRSRVRAACSASAPEPSCWPL
jgi:putative MFS transporter